MTVTGLVEVRTWNICLEGERPKQNGDQRYEPWQNPGRSAECQALCGFLINHVALSLTPRRSHSRDSDHSSGRNSRSV